MRDNFEFDDVVCQSLDIFCLLRKLRNASKQLKSAGFNIYKQFAVAVIVSKTEVDKEDYGFIVEPRNTLEYLSTSSNVEKVVPCMQIIWTSRNNSQS